MELRQQVCWCTPACPRYRKSLHHTLPTEHLCLLVMNWKESNSLKETRHLLTVTSRSGFKMRSRCSTQTCLNSLSHSQGAGVVPQVSRRMNSGHDLRCLEWYWSVRNRFVVDWILDLQLGCADHYSSSRLKVGLDIINIRLCIPCWS